MSINMNPGIDWKKEDLVLISKSGVRHFPKKAGCLSRNYVEVDQQYYGTAYSINDCGDYLSIKVFGVPQCFGKVTSFKEAVQDGDPLTLKSVWTTRYSLPTNEENYEKDDDDVEIRVYPNRKIALLHKVIVDKKTIYYVTDYRTNGVYRDRLGLSICWGGITGRLTEQNKNESFIHIVTTDEQVAKLAKACTQKLSADMLNYIREDASDLNGHRVLDPGYWHHPDFCKATQTIVENFFKFNDPCNKFIKTEYAKKKKCVNDANIRNPKDLLLWCSVKDAASAPALKKEDKVKLLLQCVQEEWDHPEKHSSEAIWARDGDNIVVIMPNPDTSLCGWSFGGKCKKFFSYNVKTKTRMYGELNGRGVWSFPIPGLNYITTAMYMGYRSCNGQDAIVKTTIKGGLSARELFNDTNIAWILDNTNGECKVLSDEDTRVSYYATNSRNAVPVDVKTYLCDDRIGTIALCILVTTGIPMLEQLLKAKLFNMYFVALYELRDRNGGNSTEIFYDRDKKRSVSYDENRFPCGPHGTALIYSGKAKNLKKMFGMSLNQLRIIDDRMQYAIVQKTGRWKRSTPLIAGMDKVLGTDISMLDLETFKRCVELSADYVNSSIRTYSYYGNSVWANAGTGIAKSFQNPNPKQVLSLIEAYQNCLGDYRDYTAMREQLRQIQALKPDVPHLFSDKAYPLRPGAAKRFIPYMNGILNRFAYWRRTEELSTTEFIRHYTQIFPDAVKRGDLQCIYDTQSESQEFLGIYALLTPAENLKYLHDDASYWVTFYQDKEKDSLFTEAAKRMYPYEWEDQTSGLRITAPRSVVDLKREGGVLHHCVASFIDPIIGGKENIVFVRRSDRPDDPFFTVEVLPDGNIRQVHCYANGELTPEGQRKAYTNSGLEVYDKDFDVVGCLIRWCKKFPNFLKASSVRASYGAMCHV